MKYKFELIVVVILIIFTCSFLYVSATNPDAEFGGADGLGAATAAEIAGMPEEDFEPLIAQWEPPSGEIESLLFSLQGAIGGILLGLGFGYWMGVKRQEKN